MSSDQRDTVCVYAIGLLALIFSAVVLWFQLRNGTP